MDAITSLLMAPGTHHLKKLEQRKDSGLELANPGPHVLAGVEPTGVCYRRAEMHLAKPSSC